MMNKLTLRSVGAAVALAALGCQTNARKELHNIAMDLQQQAAQIRQDGAPGIYTLEISGGPSEIVLLPAHGTVASFGLSAALTGEIEQRAAVGENGHLFLIRDQRLISEEPLDPMLIVSPAYTRERDTQFKMQRSKQSPQMVEISLLTPK